MASPNLNDAPSRAAFFHQTVLTNLAYWQGWLETRLSDVSALDREHERLTRAIIFALESGPDAWPLGYHLLLNLTNFMERRGHWDAWREVLSRALAAAQRLNDRPKETNLTALLARLSFQQSRFADTVRLYRRAIRLTRPLGDRFNEGRACTNLGYYYIEHGQWWRAEVLCLYALRIFEEIGNNHGRAHTENHLGFLYSRQHRWDMAQQYLEQACAIWQVMGDEHNLIWGRINLGGLYIRMEQPVLAINYLKKAIDQAKLIGEEAKIGLIYMNMGLAHHLAGNLAQAEQDTQQAEIMFRRFANIRELAHVWSIRAAICFHQDKKEEAIFHLENALATWRDLGSKPDEAHVLTDMVEYELARGNHHQARARWQEAEQIIGSDHTGWYRHLQTRLAEFRTELDKSAG